MSHEEGGTVVSNVGLVTDEMGIYEEVSDLPEQKTHKPLKHTRSAPNEPKPRKKKMKNFTRQSSDKSIDSLQGSHDPTNDIIANTGSNGQVGVAKTAPIPAPKSWKKKSVDNTSKEDYHIEGNEELYSLPHDTSSTPEPSASIVQEVATLVIDSTSLENGHSFDPSGHAVWDLETSQGNSQSKEPQVSEDLEDENLAQSFKVDDGRESSSSFVRECLAEFNLMHSQSPTHVLVDIDHMTQAKTKERGEGTNEKDDEEKVEKKGQDNRRHSYENQEIINLNVEDTKVVKQTEELLDASDTGVGLSQSDFQIVHRPDAGTPNVDGYCEVEKSTTTTTTHSQSPSLVDEVMNHFKALNTRPILPPPPGHIEDDDLTNYDLQTVVHPPVTTNAQGYSYCDLGLRDGTPSTSWSTSNINGAASTSTSTSQTIGYSEIDVLSPTMVKPPQRPPIKHPAPETAPKPQKRKPERDEVTNFSLCLEATEELAPTLSQQVSTENVESDLSDNDSLYARVSDVKTKKVTSHSDIPPPRESPRQSPRPSPKPKRKKKQISKEGRVQSPKMKKKGQPRRRPPPPPPPVAKIPGSIPLLPMSLSPDGPPTPPLSAPCFKNTPSPLEKEHKFEQTLPAYPSTHGSPSHRFGDEDLASTVTASLSCSSQTGSPKLPGRKGPLPPSPTSKGVDPASPLQKRGIFNRVKSSSVKTKRSESHTTHSPLLTDEVGRKGEQSPKIGWKKFRLRRGSAHSNSHGIDSTNGASSKEFSEVGSSVNNSESRKRRNQEDKLPEVPKAAKSQSLPSPARQINVSGASPGGIHLHPFEGEEEEEEDDLYSVVNKPEKIQPEVSRSLLLRLYNMHSRVITASIVHVYNHHCYALYINGKVYITYCSCSVNLSTTSTVQCYWEY